MTATVRYTPLVRRLAQEHRLDLSRVTGTGRGGRVTRRDVEAFLAGARPPVRPAPADMPSPARLWIEVDLTEVERARAALGTTALPVIAAATVAALGRHPALNSTVHSTVDPSVHLGVRMFPGGARRPVTPVVRDAQHLSVAGLAAHLDALAARAGMSRLSDEDTRDATFTITRAPRGGLLMAAPILDPPHTSALDIGTAVRRPVVLSTADGEEVLAIRSVAVLGLAFDHREADEVTAAEFLTTLRHDLERRPVLAAGR